MSTGLADRSGSPQQMGDVVTATFGSDLIEKTKQAKVDACRARLQSAARAAKQLETDVRWLVKERAWDVLGYTNFSEMWEKENGFECPTVVVTLAVKAVMDTHDVQDRRGVPRRGALRAADVADLIGLPSIVNPRTGSRQSSAASDIMAQLRDGTPPELVRKVKRGRSKRHGKLPTDLILKSIYLVKFQADEVTEIARKADLPDAEIYRQAVAEYLARYRESRPDVAS